MTKVTILVSNINNNLQPKLILAIMYIKNIKLKFFLWNINPYKVYFYILSNLINLLILSFTIYIFLYKKKCLIKFKKQVLQILKKTLLDYNRHPIYKVYIKDHQIVILIKNF